MSNALVERERELAEVARLLDRARAGDGAVLLLEGPAGIGKTAVLDAAAALGTGFRVLRGSGGEIERELSFGLVRDLLEPVFRGASAADRRRWLSGAAATASAVLGQAPTGAVEDVSVAYGLYWLVSALAVDQPVLLVADDLHWCDRPSLRFLVYLARRIDGLPVAVLAARRPPNSARPSLLTQLAATDAVETLALKPLSPRATEAFVTGQSGVTPDAAFSRACHEATGGNPLLLSELLETAREEGVDPDERGAERIHALAGPRLRRAVIGRLGRLTPGAVRLARAIAVLGDGCALRDGAALAGLDPADAEAALPGLVAAGVLADRDRLAFEHPLLRTAVYLDLPGPARAAEHRRAAALLRGAGAGPEAVSAHLLAAGPGADPWAPALLGAAAESALQRGSPDSAVVYLRRALAEGPDQLLRGRLMRALGNALARLGDPEASAVLEEALSLAPDGPQRHGILDESFDALVANGRADEARALILDALSGDDPVEDETITRFSARLTTLRALHGPGPDEAIVGALRRRSGELEPSVPGDRYAAGALSLLAALGSGTAAEVSALARTALGGSFHEQDARAGRPQYMVLAALGLAGETEVALSAASRALEISRGRGSLMGLGLGLAWRSLLQVLAGRVGDAETDARAALRVLAETRLREPQIGVTSSLVWALLERGEVDEAEMLLADAPQAKGWGGSVLGCFRARLQIARHDHRGALAELSEVEAAAGSAGWASRGPMPWRELAAHARLATGDTEAAHVLARTELAEAERFGAAAEIGRALRLVARIDGAAAEDPSLGVAIARLREAGAGQGAELELARALVEAGAAMRRAGERARSRPPLREAMEIAHHRGATALVERARTELRAAGARPRSVVRSGVDALTPSEHRVATLAARGLANAQIAQELFVTVRTVEMHLTATYRKLDVFSRAELPAALSTQR
jgi:DNA-binding NarL/FixJ family response regulator